jgi:tetratricopeptide (TPR) repeat protein
LAGLLAWCPHAAWSAPSAEAPQPDAPARQEAGRLNEAATRALSSGRYSDAIGLLLRAERLLPGDPGIAFNLGLSYVRAGRFRDALAPLRRACADPARRSAARFLLGSALYEDAQYGPAATELEAVRTNPEFAENALYLLEESYRKSGQAERAQQAFLDLVKLRPDSALVHKLLGTAYDAQGRSAEALAEFEKAAQAGPGLPEVRLDAGLVCLKLHDEAAARKWFDAEIALNPRSAPAHYFLGEIDRKQSRWESAEAAYRKAIQCAPDYGEAHLALGVVLQERGASAEALAHFRRAVALAPAKSEAHFQLARALAKAGHKAEAQAEWKLAQELASGPDSRPGPK